MIQWFDDSTKQWSRRELFDAVWNEDSEKVAEEMNKLLRKTISYHDYREDFYHAFLRESLRGLDMLWSQTGNMAREEVMLWLAIR